MEFAFAKGSNVEIRLDEKTLGGVKKAVCTTKNSYTDIGSFLSDIPVYREAESSYAIELTMDCSEDNVFESESRFGCLEFVGADKTEQFLDCTVENVRKIINSDGNIESVVIIRAEERKVNDRQQI